MNTKPPRWQPGRQRLACELLEDRTAPAAANVLATLDGEIEAGATTSLPFDVDADSFSFAADSGVLALQLAVEPISGDLRASALRIVSNDTSEVTPVYRSEATTIVNGSVVVAEFSAGSYRLEVNGLEGTSGEFRATIALVGDVDGSRLVDCDDVAAIVALRNVTRDDPRYQAAADVNLDGWISGFDLFLMQCNCGAGTPSRPGLSFSVNPELEPSISELPRLSPEGPQPRTVTALIGPAGSRAEFVDTELYLVTSDLAELQAFLDRWEGTVLQTEEPSRFGSDLPDIHLVQVNTDLADPEGLANDLREQDPNTAFGSFEFSDERGIRLLSAVAAEAGGDLAGRIGVNWLPKDHFVDRVSTEGPTATAAITAQAGGTYDPNAFTWPHLSWEDGNEIGVAEAWRAMELAGVLDRLTDGSQDRPVLGVLDRGFSLGDDWPTVLRSLGEPLGTSGGGGSPWHGSGVVLAGAGLADNNIGGAGPGGPVFDLVTAHHDDGFFGLFSDLVLLLDLTDRSRSDRADIVNMSWGVELPEPLRFTIFPWELATDEVQERGVLLFAAAGNALENIDHEDELLWITYETTFHTPIENRGVIGVGGISRNTTPEAVQREITTSSSGSNVGPRDVDIWAPYWVWTEPYDPADTSGVVRYFGGTSAASPFAAGVAGLIWASNPSLSADEVRDILFETAHPGDDGFVNRYVNALAAVTHPRALGDVPPGLIVVSPTSGSEFVRFVEAVPLGAEADDYEGPVTVTWRSNRDGEIGSGTSTGSSTLSYGTHLITATVTDSAGQSDSDTVSIEIINQSPVVTVLLPDPGSMEREGSIRFAADSFDNDFLTTPSAGRLPDDHITWEYRRTTSSSFLPFVERGHEVFQDFTPGEYIVRVTGDDGFGNATSQTLRLTVEVDLGEDPTARITAPASDERSAYIDGEDPMGFYTTLSLSGSGTDPQDGALTGTRLRWTTDRTDVQVADLGTGTALTVRLYAAPGQTVTRHRITLTATDSDGNTDDDFIFFDVLQLI